MGPRTDSPSGVSGVPRRALVIATACLALGWPGPAAAGLAGPAPFRQAPPVAAPSPAAGITADDISVDSTGTTVVATGHVAVAYGSMHAASDILRVVRPAGTATFSGHVFLADGQQRATAEAATVSVAEESRVTGLTLAGGASVESPGYRLRADRIAASRLTGRLTAVGHVMLASAPDIVVTGANATYDEAPGLAVVRGDGAAPAQIRNRDGRVAGSSLEYRRKTGDAEVRGPVTGEVYDATLRADGATVHLADGTAILRGHVRVARRQGTLAADRLTVYYRARRFVAEGTTHLSLTDIGEP